MKNELRLLLIVVIGIFGFLSAVAVIDIVTKFPFLFTEFNIEHDTEVMIGFILGSLLSVSSVLAVKFNLYQVKKRVATKVKYFWIGNLLFGIFLTQLSFFLIISTLNSEIIDPEQKFYNLLFVLLFLVVSIIVIRDSYNWKQKNSTKDQN